MAAIIDINLGSTIETANFDEASYQKQECVSPNCKCRCKN